MIAALFAYGRRQTETLQLHRPEVCYPAFGYALSRSEPFALELTRGVALPARRMLAELEDARESVVYWARLGEYFPQDLGAQRSARFQNTLRGIVPDGILARFSCNASDPVYGWKVIAEFAHQLVTATDPRQRKVLVGVARASELGG